MYVDGLRVIPLFLPTEKEPRLTFALVIPVFGVRLTKALLLRAPFDDDRLLCGFLSLKLCAVDCFLPLLLVFTGVPVLNREKEEARRDAFNFTATLARAFAFLATLIGLGPINCCIFSSSCIVTVLRRGCFFTVGVAGEPDG